MKFSLLTTAAMLAASPISAMPLSSKSPEMAARAVLESRATTCTTAATDNLIFTVSLASFESARNAKNPSQCNWSSDNCSWSPDKPVGFNFIPMCHRHDFGYRNTKAQSRFTATMKTRIDDNFKKDLYYYCTAFAATKEAECKLIADIYVAFVRQFGKRDESGIAFSKREGNIFEIPLDEDIEGQEIPDVLPYDVAGEEIKDLDAYFGDE